ncbi:MAG: hypothetical protein K2K00_05080 [Muribaculaceae bacterium]|nr:hypothetical protein [Muribaculaceae bacterium]
MKGKISGNALTVPLIAVCLLFGLSVVDWKAVSGGALSNFNLIEDIVETTHIASEDTPDATDDLIDPALEAAIAEVTSEAELPVHDFIADNNQEILPVPVSDATRIDEPDAIEKPVDIEEPIVAKKVAQPSQRVNGILPIEDYTFDQSGLRHLKSALTRRDSRRVRIAVIGDSYIEGDIFAQDIRRLLQQEYGGRGVGYMSMHSDFPGFRQSVNQSDQGWTVRDMRNHSSDKVKPLSGEYCIGNIGSVTTFKGSKMDYAHDWSSSKLLFIAENDGSITVKTDSLTQEFPIKAGEQVQMINIDDETSKAVFRLNSNGVKVLGAWLEDNRGVGVDCMSLRGNSGATHKSISMQLAEQMRQHVPYDLIIIEYGLNVLSHQQSKYDSYGKLMSQVVSHLKKCYPDCDIMMLGVGDRGRKNGSSVSSVSTIESLISAQRNCAAECGILFWDTRSAMGGEDAIVDWRERRLVNADYIHLNHKGGKELANEFVNSLKFMINGSN